MKKNKYIFVFLCGEVCVFIFALLLLLLLLLLLRYSFVSCVRSQPFIYYPKSKLLVLSCVCKWKKKTEIGWLNLTTNNWCYVMLCYVMLGLGVLQLYMYTYWGISYLCVQAMNVLNRNNIFHCFFIFVFSLSFSQCLAYISSRFSR
jgi:hypothetical protein